MTSQQPTDAELVQQIKQGNKRVYQILVNRHIPSLVGFFKYIGVPMEMLDDMLQETFLRVYEKLDLYDVQRSFTTWLTVIGRNIFFSEIRKKGRTIAEPDVHLPPNKLGEPDEVIVRETIRELLEILDEPSRFLVELRIFRELSFAEIAEITGDPEATLRVRFHRVLSKLRLVAQKDEAYES